MGLFSKKKTQTEKQELRYLNRKDVLELLREQTRRSAALEKEVEELKAQVKEREAALQNAAALVEEARGVRKGDFRFAPARDEYSADERGAVYR